MKCVIGISAFLLLSASLREGVLTKDQAALAVSCSPFSPPMTLVLLLVLSYPGFVEPRPLAQAALRLF